MSCTLTITSGKLHVIDHLGLITGAHRSQLFYWKFRNPQAGSFVCDAEDLHGTIEKIVGYFSRHKLPLVLADQIVELKQEYEQSKGELELARRRGEEVKSGNIQPIANYRDFVQFLNSGIARPLKQHQFKAALHLLSVQHGANFSVPGSGKTSVVLAVFNWLRIQGEIDALFVVGPPSSFGPWRTEYELVVGSPPMIEILAGGNVDNRRTKYYVAKQRLSDLYLTTYQTLQRDWERVKFFFSQAGVRFFLVLDEAHYIKQIDGAWANAVLNVTQYAKRRCVLTGTPFPNSYNDAVNLFDALWPANSPITTDDRIRIQSLTKRNLQAKAAEVLDKQIGPLFYRVRKSELGLAPQDFQPPIIVRMNQYERMAYDAIVDRLRHLSKEDYFRDLELLLTLRRGRMIRLRQAVSYTRLLSTAVSDYDEQLLEDRISLAELIRGYDSLESPAKQTTLLQLVESLRQRKEKVLVWSNFIGTLKLILREMRSRGHAAELIYGETPTERTNVQDELTREQIIAAFMQPSDGIDVLVANPAACAESISLHKGCAHAIYYDLSYNCAQYLQSLDRIHRVGGSEERIAHYYFLQYADTIDADILENVQHKARNMSTIVDQDYPIYDLDMFTVDDELAAYERIFG